MAVLSQYLLCMIASIAFTVQFSPAQMLCGGCSEASHGGVSHETPAIRPFVMSEMNLPDEMMCEARSVSRTWRTISSG